MYLNNSPDKCTEVPLPDDAMFTLVGLALQYAINSATFFTGRLLVTTITLGVRTIPATGVMSRIKLKFSFLYRVALMPLAGLTSNMV